MKKTFTLKILIFCLCSHFFADVANSVKSVCALESPFCLSKKTDGALLGAGIFLSGADLFLDNVLKINRQTFDENRSFEKNLAARIQLPYTKWWYEQNYDKFIKEEGVK